MKTFKEFTNEGKLNANQIKYNDLALDLEKALRAINSFIDDSELEHKIKQNFLDTTRKFRIFIDDINDEIVSGLAE